MKASENLIKFLEKKGRPVAPVKVKEKESGINSAAKQKELLLRIGRDLGYIE